MKKIYTEKQKVKNINRLLNLIEGYQKRVNNCLEWIEYYKSELKEKFNFDYDKELRK